MFGEAKNMDAKTVSFVLMMGVLGNVLAAISYYTGNLIPGVIAIDFSLVAAYIAGFYGGPLIGFISGLFVGIFPGIIFGPMGTSSWLGLFSLPLGKGLTGLTAGLVSRGLGLGRRLYSSLLAAPATLLSYIPEFFYTYVHFAYLMPLLLGMDKIVIGNVAFGMGDFFLIFILPKALSEVAIISFVMAALIGNRGFNEFVRRFFTKPYISSKFQTDKPRLEA